jgi:aldehyde:ferredoxin oxidoreductase
MYGRPREEFTGNSDPLAEKEKGELIARVQKEQALEDSLIACTFGNTGLDLNMYAQMLLSATGLEVFEDADHLLKIGERVVCLERCFNVREGFRRKDDALPQRMISEPLRNAGPTTGQLVKDLDRLLDEYYAALGYTQDGIPTANKIKDLELESLVSDMEDLTS